VRVLVEYAPPDPPVPFAFPSPPAPQQEIAVDTEAVRLNVAFEVYVNVGIILVV
jgi:hypothetical protein